MKISLNWLNEYIDLKEFFEKPSELGAILTAAGLELEGLQALGAHLDHVKIGEIKKLDRHPNADRLTLCQVDVGDKNLKQIVCGAKNHKQGDKVVVALPGAILPGNFAIKLSKIRDVESQGMLCSDKELGISAESEGIRILPKEAPVGELFKIYAGLNDVIFEINVTPNRADCLSHVGLARELSTLLGKKINYPASEIKKSKLSIKDYISVELKTKELCPRYAARVVSGVKVGPSPSWLKSRLESVGVNSINNIVDVTNFVMLEYGQPMHAFDLNELADKKIIIDRAGPAEVFTTLDSTELKLTSENLTIRDGKRAVALAGVVGGKNSGVSDKTSSIMIESAHFVPMTVRKTSRRLGVDTDSSYRFSRGTDPENVVEALNRAASMIQAIAGGEVSKDLIDKYPVKANKKPIQVRLVTLEDRLGNKVKMNDFISWMKRLHCEVKGSGKACLVKAPAFRFDLEQEMDLVEEYARLNGYDKIPESFPALLSRPTSHSREYTIEEKVRAFCLREGFLQAVNYHFVSSAWQKSIVEESKWNKLGLNVGGELVALKNPLSDETGVMRQSLLPGLLTNLIYNHHHNLDFGRLFEVGHVFGRESQKYNEPHRLSFVVWGRPASIWKQSERPNAYDLKANIEALLTYLGAKGYDWRRIDEMDTPAILHPGQAAALFYQGKNVGFLGTIHPSLKDKHKLRVDVALAEFDLNLLFQGYPKLLRFEEISKMPAVERDVSFLVPDSIMASDILREMKRSGGELLKSATVFDSYRGGGVQAGHVAIAFRMRFQSVTESLSDEKVNTLFQGIIAGVKQKFAVETR